LRVLWFNWRDIKHPDAGGAEVFTHEVMRRLVNKGYDMTLFSPRFLNSLEYECIDGINVRRDGGKYTVYSKARHYYEKYMDSYDIVIDEINVKPFLTPKFVKERPILALVHEVARDALFTQLHFPLNYIVRYYLVSKWLSYYKDILTLTVSDSTRRYLKEFGLKKIFLVPQGLSVTPLHEIKQKESKPTVVFLGRLKKYKLPHHAIEAFSLIKTVIPDAKMWIIGDGDMHTELERLNVKDITFFGRVEEALKYDLLSKAHLALVPGVQEGWGLVVTECNAMGTPVVAYNVAGLRDSVRDGETGILVIDNSKSGLASSAISLLKDRDLLNRYSNNALAFSRQFSWDNTANVFDKIISDMVRKCTLS
jgi:glycosyltransferase involved in cell wall biosynthesis